jgi:hypothetical protein
MRTARHRSGSSGTRLEIGLGRPGGSHDEFAAVFFRRARLVPLEYDHFWLSDTPDVIGSATWGNRTVAW